MKREIPYDLENYNLISLSDLECKELNSTELEILYTFIKKYNSKRTPGIIMGLTVGIFLSFCSYI